MTMKAVRAIAIVFATALGAGFSPVAPGTCGTAAAVPLFYTLAHLPPCLYLVVLAALTAAGTWAAKITGDAWGEVDDQRIVIDEVAGYLVTMAVSRPTVHALIAGFVLFRLFDILKPWPAGWADKKVKNAFGVMLDDLFAGCYGLASMVVLGIIWPHLFPLIF